LAALAVLSLLLYSFKLKGLPFAGNLVIAAMGALTFIYGGIAVGNVYGIVFPAIFSFLYHLGREITKDIEDELADKSRGIITLPGRYGRPAACNIARGSFILLVGLTPVPFLLGLYGAAYLVSVVVTVDLLLIYVVWHIKPDCSGISWRKLNGLLKVGMVFGLVSLLLGRFG